jgi:hypothetical protein
MTDCPNCVAASEREWHHYNASCMVCEARRISRGKLCAEAKALGVITPAYKDELCAVAGDVHWYAVHELVCAWQRGDALTQISSDAAARLPFSYRPRAAAA